MDLTFVRLYFVGRDPSVDPVDTYTLQGRPLSRVTEPRSPLMDELHDSKVRLLPSQIQASQVEHNQFKTPSGSLFIGPSRTPRDVTFKGKTLTELKQEFEQECEKIEQGCPELARKDGWSVLHEMLTNRDEKDIKNHYDNIDTLLVFVCRHHSLPILVFSYFFHCRKGRSLLRYPYSLRCRGL